MDELESGTLVEGRYVVEALIGHGGMAEVYRVRHVHLDTLHALKVLTVSSGSIRRRLMQEGRVQAALQHPNIVSVTDVVVVDSSPGLVMEYIRGPAMDDCLDALELTNDQIDALAVGVMDGVAAAHALDLIHRDLKPANVMLAVTHDAIVPKVADFGLVKLLAGDDDGFQSKTRSGSTMGTPAYMAPEQIRDSKNVDARADVWSLGAILYELVSGRRAFDGEDVLDLFMKVAGGERQAITDLCPDLPDRWVKAIEGSLSVKREYRISTVADLRAQWLEGAKIKATSPWDETILEAAQKLGSGGDNTKDFLRRSFKSTVRARRKKVDTGQTEVPTAGSATTGSGSTVRSAPAATMALEGQTAVPETPSVLSAPPVDTLVPQGSGELSVSETLSLDSHEAPAGDPPVASRRGRRLWIWLAALFVGVSLVAVLGAGAAGALVWNGWPSSWFEGAPTSVDTPAPTSIDDPATDPVEPDPVAPDPDDIQPDAPDPVAPDPSAPEPDAPEPDVPEEDPAGAPDGPSQDPNPDEPVEPPEPDVPEPDANDGVAEAPEENSDTLPPLPSTVAIDARDMTVILKDASGRKATLGSGGRVTNGSYTVVAFFEPRVPTEVGHIEVTPGSSWSVRCLKNAARCIVKRQ
jgi:serine/threonine protein kinase